MKSVRGCTLCMAWSGKSQIAPLLPLFGNNVPGIINSLFIAELIATDYLVLPWANPAMISGA
ncbi:MAG: hypothetical protein HKO73_08910 [Woeseiaceae bacterium]|nr:hypothetical protein [Woeseiaceae bacterium]